MPTSAPGRLRSPFPVRRVAALALALLVAPLPGRADAPGLSAEPPFNWAAALLEPFDVVSRWVLGLFSNEERFVADEIERFKRTVDTDLSPFDALVRQAGFRLSSVSVGAGAPPQVSLSMEFTRRLGESEKAALMARITDASGVVGTVERGVVMTLLNAADSAYATRGDGYRLTGVTIDVEVVPNVTFVMAKRP